MAKNTDSISTYAKQKNQETIDKVNKAIDSLKHSKTQPINFETVAKKAGVARATLYNNPILKERIQSLRDITKKDSSLSEVIPKDKLQLQTEKISVLRQEIIQLKSDKQKLIVQLVEMEGLKKENEKLKRRLLKNGAVVESHQSIRIPEKQEEEATAVEVVTDVIIKLTSQGCNIRIEDIMSMTGFSRTVFDKPYIRRVLVEHGVVEMSNVETLKLTDKVQRDVAYVLAEKDGYIDRLLFGIEQLRDECENLRSQVHLLTHKNYVANENDF